MIFIYTTHINKTIFAIIGMICANEQTEAAKMDAARSKKYNITQPTKRRGE